MEESLIEAFFAFGKFQVEVLKMLKQRRMLGRGLPTRKGDSMI